MATTQVSAEPGVPFIDISREFEAPRDLVFRAHTDPELLVQWLGGSKYQMIIDRYDVRDGGSWRYVHRDGDGNDYGFHGVFHGTPSPDGMVQTFEFEGAPGYVSLDAITLEEEGGRTRVRIHSVHQTVEGRDAMVASGMEAGLDAGYQRLDELIARLVPVA
ncbi:MAG TPA: SRPBCC family protein [Candidatus Limnocylindrales bacterium]|nr:SRPBCC family protein [Candidatus Limnocylindrales bacterium]